MRKILLNRKTREKIEIIAIKKWDYEYDFDKLVDRNGNLWLPDELEVIKT